LTGLYAETSKHFNTRLGKVLKAEFTQHTSLFSRIFGSKRDEVTGEWRKLHNEELHDFYCSPSIIRIKKARGVRWAWHVARMGRRGTCTGCWWESQREGGH
jgi:hypothetical protein